MFWTHFPVWHYSFSAVTSPSPTSRDVPFFAQLFPSQVNLRLKIILLPCQPLLSSDLPPTFVVKSIPMTCQGMVWSYSTSRSRDVLSKYRVRFLSLSQLAKLTLWQTHRFKKPRALTHSKHLQHSTRIESTDCSLFAWFRSSKQLNCSIWQTDTLSPSLQTLASTKQDQSHLDFHSTRSLTQRKSHARVHLQCVSQIWLSHSATRVSSAQDWDHLKCPQPGPTYTRGH